MKNSSKKPKTYPTSASLPGNNEGKISGEGLVLATIENDLEGKRRRK
jgi:hypothetical protein